MKETALGFVSLEQRRNWTIEQLDFAQGVSGREGEAE